MKRNERNNVIEVGGSEELERSNRRRAEKRRRSHVGLIIGIDVLLVIAAVSVFVYLKLRTFNGYKVIQSTETTFEANAQYADFGDNLLKYTPDGVS